MAMRNVRVAAIVGALGLAFLGGQWSAQHSLGGTRRPPSAVPMQDITIRRSPTPGWVEVWRGPELESEWGAQKDSELWRWLDMLLREAPELYVPAHPGEPPHGRGPALQQAWR